MKGTMVHAHLDWAKLNLKKDYLPRVEARLTFEVLKLLRRGVLATDWVPLKALVEIDRAIAADSGQRPDEAYRSMGRHSASQNLSGVYRQFTAAEPHRFFEQMAVLHGRFQNFGRCVYERLHARSGRVRHEGYAEYSPVYCMSGGGYYEGALQAMKVPGPLRIVEKTCQCAGDPACLYELAW